MFIAALEVSKEVLSHFHVELTELGTVQGSLRGTFGETWLCLLKQFDALNSDMSSVRFFEKGNVAPRSTFISEARF